MLDVHLRKLSGGRDGYRSTRPVSPSFADITAFINEMNAGGVGYSTRLSPRVMTDVLDVAGRWVADFAMSLAPDETAYISVLWAGEEQSANWMDIGREYTEFWHHQMQIRDAVNAAPLLQRRWLHPLLDLSVRAFPRAYAGRDGADGFSASSLKSPATTRMTGHSCAPSLAGTCGAGVTIARDSHHDRRRYRVEDSLQRASGRSGVATRDDRRRRIAGGAVTERAFSNGLIGYRRAARGGPLSLNRYKHANQSASSSAKTYWSRRRSRRLEPPVVVFKDSTCSRNKLLRSQLQVSSPLPPPSTAARSLER